MLKVQEIREIIKLIDQSSITEFTYETEGTSVCLKKEQIAYTVVEKETPVDRALQQQEPTAAETPTPAVSQKEETEDKSPAPEQQKNYDLEIVSPMVGTFYSASSPENDPYVSVGSTVNADSVVCIVEAMKLFNEIEAEVSGEIVEILVQNGELVEYGQPLFRVKKK